MIKAFKGSVLALTLTLCSFFFASAFPTPSFAAFATDDEQNTIDIFRAANPAVVYVTNQALVRDPYSLNLQTVPSGAGTGFVWDKQGYVVTNYHVIEGARQITITLQNQTHYQAQVVGIAPEKDLAVLRIKAKAKDLHPLPIGNSNDLTVGRKVLAIGNPFGLDTTLTVGVVSALGREINAANNRTIRNVIQTDAAINPGNSGGPLLNSSGELIGVNTAIYSPSGASVGIGFAIPVNTVKKIVPHLIQHGRLVRPALGIEVAPEHWAAQYRVKGVPLLRATPGLPAQKAGMQGMYRNRWGATVLGDVIISLGGQVVESQDDLLSALENFKPGDTVKVEAVRDGEIKQYQVQLIGPEQQRRR
jgi:S1-C subfamily serine protease